MDFKTNADYRLMQVKSIAECSNEHSEILLTFTKLPVVIKIFVLSIFEWSFYTGFIALYFVGNKKGALIRMRRRAGWSVSLLFACIVIRGSNIIISFSKRARHQREQMKCISLHVHELRENCRVQIIRCLII